MRRRDKKRRSLWRRVRQSVGWYAGQLRRIAAQVTRLVQGFSAQDPSASARLESDLDRYAELLQTWAVNTARRMLIDVAQRDEKHWKALSQAMSHALRQEIREAPTGEAMRELLAEQVALIQSLPREAAQRVHRLAQAGIENGARADEIAKAILRSGEVTASRANLIARTETSRAAMVFTQVRAQHIGSEGYIWRTAEDGDVRTSHRKMNGRFVQWDAPPTLDGLTGHAGCLPNCRCYAEPVIPD